MEEQRTHRNNNILVSVIIAAFNAEKDIAACLESIKLQRNANIEIVIVDGESSDKTIDTIARFEYDKLICISEPDKGIYDALNKGIRIARGEWLYFLGADDRLLPGFSELLLQLTDKTTVYYGNSEPFYEGNDPGYTILTGSFTKYRMCKVCINHQSIIYPSKVFAKYQYDLKYKVFADWALNIKVWADNDFKKEFFPIKIARYNLTGFSSRHNDEAFEKDKPGLIRKHMGFFLYLRWLFKQFKRRRKL